LIVHATEDPLKPAKPTRKIQSHLKLLD